MVVGLLGSALLEVVPVNFQMVVVVVLAVVDSSLMVWSEVPQAVQCFQLLASVVLGLTRISLVV